VRELEEVGQRQDEQAAGGRGSAFLEHVERVRSPTATSFAGSRSSQAEVADGVDLEVLKSAYCRASGHLRDEAGRRGSS
jgi:hypothetical protein